MAKGNLKPAPIALTEAMVAKLVGDRPAYGKGVVRVPFAPFALVDRPKGGRDDG